MDDNTSLMDELRRRGPGSHAGAVRPERESPNGRGGETVGEEPADNVPAFGAYRGSGERAAHLEFQRLQGSWPAFGYAWLVSPEWAAAGDARGRGQAIVLHYASGHTVTVRGRNLRPLHERILRQQAYRVSEMGEEADRFLPEDQPVVYAIDVRAPEGAA